MREALPDGWVKTTLGELAEPSRERVLPSENPHLRYVGLEHIEPHTMKLLEYGLAREVRSSSMRYRQGDVLYGKMRPYLNKVWLAEFDGLCSAEFLVFPKRNGLNSQFLAMRLNADDFVNFANGQVSGERPRVDFEKLSSFPILLPPTSEQERIVVKLSSALSRTKRAETAVLRAQDRLKRFRAAVLHSAVTGELTRAWREVHRKNKKNKAETGEALLQRLLTARRMNWEDSQLEQLRSTDNMPTNDNWKARYQEPTAASAESLPAVPDTWTWVSIEQLTCLVTSGSRGWKSYYSKTGAVFIRSQDIRKDRLDLAEVAHVRPPKASEGMRTQVKQADLLVTITGANVGKAGDDIDLEISYRDFTLEKLPALLSEFWNIPAGHLVVTYDRELPPGTKMHLPKGKSLRTLKV